MPATTTNSVSDPSAAIAPAGERLLDYFVPGVQVAMIPGGMMVAVQADHMLGDNQADGRARIERH